MNDIVSRADIIVLVDSFYQTVRADDILGPIFNDIANVNWATHLPKMYDFWQTTLLNQPAYKGNPVTVHQRVNSLTPLNTEAFSRWLNLFDANVDELFAGPNADRVKVRALSIATVLQAKLAMDDGLPVIAKRNK